MLASEKWPLMVEAEHAQSEAMRGAVPPPQDYWRGRAEMFRADPFRKGDELLERLAGMVGPGDRMIDVGAGGGRMALPLALRCREVVAVEPSASMVKVLEDSAREAGIGNVEVVNATWEEAEVTLADLVICCHVVYTVRDIAGFLRKLTGHASKRVAVVVYSQPPQSQIYDIWKEVHGEERLPLPSMPELREVLEELQITPSLDWLERQPPQGFESLERAADQLEGRLYITPGSPEADRLRSLLPDLLEETGDGWRIRGSRPMWQVIVSWDPSPSRG